MRVAVFGAGYVGLVTGACLADLGHDVVVRDVVVDKVEALRRGEVPDPRGGTGRAPRAEPRAPDLHDRSGRGGGGGRRGLHRGRNAADVLGRRGSLRRLDRGRGAAAGRPPAGPRDEEHRSRGDRPKRPPSARRSRADERRLRVEPGVHGRGNRGSRLHASRPNRHRRVRGRRRRCRRRAARGHRRAGRAHGRRVGGDGQARLERVPHDAR